MKIYYMYYSNAIIFFFTAYNNIVQFLDELYFRYIVKKLRGVVEIMSNFIESRSQYRMLYSCKFL